METSLQCWLYQCSNPACNLPGVINETVLEHSYPEGRVPCPKCGQEMARIRQAQPGEYDLETQEALAAWETHTWNFRLALPWEAFGHCNLGTSVIDATYPNNEFQTRINDDHKNRNSRAGIETFKFLTESDVANILGISVKAVRQLIKEKRLQSIRLTKRKKVFTRAVIDEFIRREVGLISPASKNNCLSSNLQAPRNNPISLEESRSLLRNLRQNPSSNEEQRSISAGSRR